MKHQLNLVYVGVKLDVPKEDTRVKRVIYFVDRCVYVYIAPMKKVMTKNLTTTQLYMKMTTNFRK